MSEHKSSFRQLVEMTDRIAREELGEYYMVSSSRMDNILQCLETGAEEINTLTTKITELEAQLAKGEALRRPLQDMVDMIGAGDEHGMGSRWYIEAITALTNSTEG